MLTLGLALLMGSSSIMGTSTVSATGAACAKPDTPVTVKVEPAMLPPLLTDLEEHGSTKLIITLSPNTAVPLKVELVQPSGDAILDSAAEQMARETTFTPETQSCNAVGGRYFYDFEF